MHVRKELAGNAPGYSWPTDGAVVEVDEETALELLAIPEGGFSEAPAEAGEASENPEAGDDSEQAPTKGRKRTPVTE